MIDDITQASLADADVTADAVTVKANNRNQMVSATGGLAFAKTDSGNAAVGLAGAFSYNDVNTTVDAFVRDAKLDLRGVDLNDSTVVTTDQRLSVTADNVADIWTLSAGLAGAIAAGGTGGGGGGSAAISVAGSVSLNEISGHARAAARQHGEHADA